MCDLAIDFARPKPGTSDNDDDGPRSLDSHLARQAFGHDPPPIARPPSGRATLGSVTSVRTTMNKPVQLTLTLRANAGSGEEILRLMQHYLDVARKAAPTDA